MPRRAGDRRDYIDWARGIAVLIMIQVHVLDAWTVRAAQSSDAFRNLQLLGGFAAPLFLWLAGLVLVLAAERHTARHGDRGEACRVAVARGLEIFVLGFAFRLQSFLFSLGASPLTIFRVDILNVMGLSLAAAGCLWGLVPARRQLIAFSATALGIAMVTPIIRVSPWVDGLPVWFQWYLRPAAEHTTFTGFPWAGFVFAGGAIGTLVTRATRRQERRLHVGMVGAGAALVVIGVYLASLPSIYRESSFWTSSPTFFIVRVGVLMMVLACIFAAVRLVPVGRLASSSWQWLPALGRSSLFVYWIHVELVYGWVAWPLRRSLSLGQALLAWAALVALMYALVGLRDRFMASWRSPRGGRVPDGFQATRHESPLTS